MIISREEIKKQLHKWEKAFFAYYLSGESFFPKEVKFSKVKAKDTLKNFAEIHKKLLELRKNSKNNIGKGYWVEWIERNDRKIGKNAFPSQILIQTEDDYFYLAGKEYQHNYECFKTSVKLIEESLPQLHEWVADNISKTLKYYSVWPDLLKVCHYFLEHTQPDLYTRELPITVHTKFIENHKLIIDSLLKFLLSPKAINTEVTGIANFNFEKRYGLKYPEPLIRFRYLNPKEAPVIGFQDCSLPLSNFCQIENLFNNVVITENKMTFLTLPTIPDTIAIFGTGYGVDLLKSVEWLEKTNIYYWGDIDVNGFHILSNLRKYFPKVKSIMMDWETFEQFNSYHEHDNKVNPPHAKRLTLLESEVFDFVYVGCKNDEVKNRLEQEHIDQEWANKKIKEALG